MRRGAAALGLAVLSVAGIACSAEKGPFPAAPQLPAAATTTTELDYATVGLRGVPPGRQNTTVAIAGGSATIGGTVLSPDGAVPDADILVERIVNDGIGSMRIKAGADGVWKLPNVVGGRYRIRAWRSPDFALVKPVISFIGATENRTIDLRVSSYGGLAVKPAIAPNPPLVARPATLVVLVTTRTVDSNGVVRATPVPGVRVELVGSSAWRVESPNPATSDGQGEATWTLRCRDEGRQQLAATVGDGDTLPLEIPACQFPATTTTFEESPSTTSFEETTTTR